MSNIVTLVNALATVMGSDIKSLSASVQTALNREGDLATLTTTEKSTLVGALNELKAGLNSVTSTAIDAATAQSMIDAGIAALVNGAPDALNTLNELAAALNEDQTALDGILQALAKRVRVDAVQNFTDEEKTQGRSNIGAAASADVGDVGTADFVATYTASKA